MWSKLAVWGWVGLLIGLLVYELWSVLDKNPHTPSLTQVTIRYAPWWVTLPVICWLWVHFAIRYFKLTPK